MSSVAYKLIAIDMDGTLLASDHRLSVRTRVAVTSLIERDFHVVIATGRPFEIVRVLCPGIPFAAPQITFNGAVVFDPIASRPVTQICVPTQHVTGVIEYLLHAGVPPVACAIDAVYLDSRITDPEVWVPPHLVPGRPLSEVYNGATNRLLKIAGECDAALITRIRPAAEAAFKGSLYVTQTAPRLIEFLHPSVSKGAALRLVSATLGITKDEILVFGDSHNDVTLFDAAGLSVAMGNASHEVKRAADRVTVSNDQDGVALILEEMGLVPPYEEASAS